MSDERSEFYNRISSLFEENKIQFPDSIIMHPRYKRDIAKTYAFGIDPAAPDSDTTILGMKVHYSPFVEEGTVYIVNNPRNFGYGKMPVIDREIHDAIGKHFQRFFDHAWLHGDKPGFTQERSYNWHRFPNETILQWGDRLFERDLLDNPAIRWEYQKAVLGVPFNALKAVWLKVRP